MAQSALIYIDGEVDLTTIIEEVRKDFAFIDKETLIIRVPKLPVGSKVEIELVCDASCASLENGSKFKLGCTQQAFSDLEAFGKRAQIHN